MKFHDTLNEKIWDLNTEDLIPEVKEKLEEIAEAFIEFLEIPTDALLDKVITGSSASYNYNEFSDLDLHIIVDYDKVHEDCPLVNGYLNSLKKQFNDNHDITIHGVPVELYAEQKDQGTVHNGLYSLQTGWIDKPQKIEPTDNDAAVEAKYNEIKELVDKCDDSEEATELLEKIYNMRKAGLAEAGEFCTENLAFKKLRNEGCMDKLRKIKKEQIDKQLSLESYNEDKEAPKTLDYFINKLENRYPIDFEQRELGLYIFNSNQTALSWDDEFKLIKAMRRGWKEDNDTQKYYAEKSLKSTIKEANKIAKNLRKQAKEQKNKNESIKEDFEDEDIEYSIDFHNLYNELWDDWYYNKVQAVEKEITKELKAVGFDYGCMINSIGGSTYECYVKLNKEDGKQQADTFFKIALPKLKKLNIKNVKKNYNTVDYTTPVAEILFDETLNEQTKQQLLASKNESIKEGFNKGDKVQLKRKNNKIGIVKSIFNGDKDKNDKDIKYLDVEFEDGTKEGRPASDFKKVNESLNEGQSIKKWAESMLPEIYKILRKNQIPSKDYCVLGHVEICPNANFLVRKTDVEKVLELLPMAKENEYWDTKGNAASIRIEYDGLREFEKTLKSVNEEYKAGDEITIDGKTGVIDSTFRFAEDDSLLGVWVKFGKEVKYYTLEELNDKSKNEDKEMNEDIKTEYAIINFLKKYGFATQEDLYNNIGAQVFVIDNAVKELLKQDKIKFEDGQGQDGINGWKLTEQIEEDLATLEKKVDKVEQDIQTIIQSYTNNESLFNKLDESFKKALNEDSFIDKRKFIFTVDGQHISGKDDCGYSFECDINGDIKDTIEDYLENETSTLLYGDEEDMELDASEILDFKYAEQTKQGEFNYNIWYREEYDEE